MSPRRALVLLLLACLFSSGALAYASPPDPTWVGDDVVISISWAAWAVELDPLAVVTPLFASVPFVPLGEPRLASIARTARLPGPGAADSLRPYPASSTKSLRLSRLSDNHRSQLGRPHRDRVLTRVSRAPGGDFAL